MQGKIITNPALRNRAVVPKKVQQESSLEIAQRIANKIVARGAVGIAGMTRSFRIMDKDRNGNLSYEEVKRAIANKSVILFPVERSWQYFAPCIGSCGTLCTRSKFVVGCFHQHPPSLRPLLPAEYFSLQGMPLHEMIRDQDTAEQNLAEFLDFAKVRSLAGNAFHLPTSLVAMIATLVSGPTCFGSPVSP